MMRDLLIGAVLALAATGVVACAKTLEDGGPRIIVPSVEDACYSAVNRCRDIVVRAAIVEGLDGCVAVVMSQQPCIDLIRAGSPGYGEGSR